MWTARPGFGAGVFYVLAATVGWSLAGVFVRFVPDLDGWQINCWRGYWMSVFLLAYLVALYGRDTFTKFRDVPPGALVGSAAFFTAGSTCYVTALTLTDTATVSVIGALSPIFAGTLSPWVTGERATVASWAAAVMAVAGVLVMAWDSFSAGALFGIGVALLVPLSFAAQTVTLRRYRDVDMMPAICAGGFATFIVAGGLGTVFGSSGNGFAVNGRELLLLAVMGPVQLAIPIILYAVGARAVTAVTLTMIVMLDVVLNPFWAWAGVGETPAPSAYAGGAIIVGAVLVSIVGERFMTARSFAHA